MKELLKRGATSFAISAMCGLIVNLLIEIIVRGVTGDNDFVTLSPEFSSIFPSQTIAVQVNILLYGVIGAAFSIAAFIYQVDRIGFIIQNLIYFIITSIVWIPIVTWIWQLQEHMQALRGTLTGFAGTYIIMSIVGYKTIKRDIHDVNEKLNKLNG